MSFNILRVSVYAPADLVGAPAELVGAPEGSTPTKNLIRTGRFGRGTGRIGRGTGGVNPNEKSYWHRLIW
jgi:hypothetical protein